MRFGLVVDLRDARGGFVGARHVQAALHLGAVFDGDVPGDHVADDVTGAADGDRIAAVQIAFDFAEDQNLARLDIGGQAAVGANDDFGVFQMDLAFDLAIDVEVFAAADFAAAYGLSFEIGLDSNGEVQRSYLVRALPTTFFIDRQGEIREVVLGGPLAEAYLRAVAADLLSEPP